MTMLQWNVRGVRARSGDLRLLLHELNPSFVCLQELKLPDEQQGSFTVHPMYKSYLKLPRDNAVPKGGALVAVRHSVPHDPIDLRSDLQAVAVKLHAGDLKSLCSLYLPPDAPVTLGELCNLIAQLPAPTLLLGDFNAHNPLWFDNSLDARGRLVQSAIETENLFCLNGDQHTYFRSYDQSSSNIDLALISSQCAANYDWTTLDDLNGSDHFPVVISPTLPTPPLSLKSGT